MTVNTKLQQLSIESSKYLSALAFPPLTIIYSAIESENNKIKQKNMNDKIDMLFNEVSDLKEYLLKELDSTSNKVIHEVVKNIGDEFEHIRQDAYSYLLVHTLKETYSTDILQDVLFQLNNLDSKSLIEFKKLYENDLKTRESVDFPTLLKILGYDIVKLNKQNNIKIENFVTSGNQFDFTDLDRITLNRLEYVGIVNVPRYVYGSGDLSDFYKPTFTDKAKNLYEITLVTPK